MPLWRRLGPSATGWGLFSRTAFSLTREGLLNLTGFELVTMYRLVLSEGLILLCYEHVHLHSYRARDVAAD